MFQKLIMDYQFNFQAVLAICFFCSPLIYKRFRGNKVELTDVLKCAIAAMSLPDLILCLFYLVFNPSKAYQIAETKQYFTIAILVVIYITGTEIYKTFISSEPIRGEAKKDSS